MERLIPQLNGALRSGDRKRPYGLEQAAIEVTAEARPALARPGSPGTSVRCRALVGCRPVGIAADGWLEVTPIPVYSPVSKIWVDVSGASR